MRTIYRYRDLEFPVADNTDVIMTVEFISDGNTALTFINVPGSNDPKIEDEGSVLLGKGEDLRSETTISVSDVSNLVPEEDDITIQYKLNGTLIQQHTNSKNDEEHPIIILFIKFPKV